jgi:hypothetical protein
LLSQVLPAPDAVGETIAFTTEGTPEDCGDSRTDNAVVTTTASSDNGEALV